MRLICPNCEQSNVPDAAPHAAAPARSSCPRCGVELGTAPFAERRVAPGINPASAPASLAAARAQAPAAADDEDVLALPLVETHDGATAAAAADSSAILELEDELEKEFEDNLSEPDARPARAAAAADRYGLAVRLMNLSPLWLLASGIVLITFVLFCNWLLAGRSAANSAPSALAARRNEASNRSVPPPAHAAEERPTDAAPQSRTDAAPQGTQAQSVGYSSALETPRPQDATTEHVPAEAEQKQIESADARATATAANTAAEPAGVGGAGSKYTIQLGAYRVAAGAEKHAAELRAAGFEARIVEERVASKGVLNCVQVGRFDTRAELEAQLARLREKGLAPAYVAREIR
jgi:cell division septation protein DedD